MTCVYIYLFIYLYKRKRWFRNYHAYNNLPNSIYMYDYNTVPVHDRVKG